MTMPVIGQGVSPAGEKSISTYTLADPGQLQQVVGSRVSWTMELPADEAFCRTHSVQMTYIWLKIRTWLGFPWHHKKWKRMNVTFTTKKRKALIPDTFGVFTSLYNCRSSVLCINRVIKKSWKKPHVGKYSHKWVRHGHVLIFAQGLKIQKQAAGTSLTIYCALEKRFWPQRNGLNRGLWGY